MVVAILTVKLVEVQIITYAKLVKDHYSLLKIKDVLRAAELVNSETPPIPHVRAAVKTVNNVLLLLNVLNAKVDTKLIVELVKSATSRTALSVLMITSVPNVNPSCTSMKPANVKRTVLLPSLPRLRPLPVINVDPVAICASLLSCVPNALAVIN